MKPLASLKLIRLLDCQSLRTQVANMLGTSPFQPYSTSVGHLSKFQTWLLSMILLAVTEREISWRTIEMDSQHLPTSLSWH